MYTYTESAEFCRLMVHVFKIFGGLTSFIAALARVESKILIKHEKHA